MKEKTKDSPVRSVVAHIVLILLSILCLFFFYILIINATRSHAELQRGFSFLPGTHFIENLMKVANDGTFPMFRGILNSLLVSGSCAAICTCFSALTAYGLYAYFFRLRRAAFTFIMAILVMPTQVTAMGFLRLITGMGRCRQRRRFDCPLRPCGAPLPEGEARGRLVAGRFQHRTHSWLPLWGSCQRS